MSGRCCYRKSLKSVIHSVKRNLECVYFNIFKYFYSIFFPMTIVNIINKSAFEYNPACNLVWGKEFCMLTWLTATSMAFVVMSVKCSKPKGQSNYLICSEGKIWVVPWFLFQNSCWPLQRLKDFIHGSM